MVDGDVFGHADAPDKILVERLVRATRAGLEGPGLADHHFEKHFKTDKARRRAEAYLRLVPSRGGILSKSMTADVTQDQRCP